MRKEVEKTQVYDMEAAPFVPNNQNNALSCEDVMKVAGILRSSLANPQHAIEDARSFAETVSPADKTLNEFIAKIVCRGDDSCVEETRLSQINTTTEIYTARITHNGSNSQHGEESLEEEEYLPPWPALYTITRFSNPVYGCREKFPS